ncbi:MFS transporter [Bradyrhizobium sp. ISRA442]|uniref:MFS transporter n=1 Tax=Bradyrhizobium sp. ISRA442 TaxID=2866197 RepID=UPI00311AE777
MALGGAGIVSYGTLYYCVAAIAKEASRDLAVTEGWILGCFSFALLASALMSLVAGRLMDRYGAGKTMKVASFVGAASLGIVATSWNAVVFAIALFGMQLASAFLFYEAAFVFLVQRDAVDAKRQMADLTLIVGFSSALCWPLTSLLLTSICWRQVCWIYGSCNVLLAMPLIQLAGKSSPRLGDQSTACGSQDQSSSKLMDLVLMTVGFSLTTFAFLALLSRMIPILSSIGLDLQERALVSMLFGPSQLAVRLFAGSFSERISPIKLTIHSLIAIVIFIAFVGCSSGLNSICRGEIAALSLWTGWVWNTGRVDHHFPIVDGFVCAILLQFHPKQLWPRACLGFSSRLRNSKHAFIRTRECPIKAGTRPMKKLADRPDGEPDVNRIVNKCPPP